MLKAAGNFFRFLASLKVAIPLLVLTVAVTILGSLQPQPEFFRTWWYLGLLGLNGVSLLFITLLHIPAILVKKGRNALIGVVATHLGILILIVGAIYGGVSGFRYQVKAIEQEMTVVPGLPFVIRLDELTVEDYPEEVFAHLELDNLPKKRQESRLTLFRNGEPWKTVTAGPGWPAKVAGITILPAVNDIGWYFELVVTDPQGREKTIPVRPWAPPLITVQAKPVMVHSLADTGELMARVFTIEGDQMTILGTVSKNQPLELDGHTISLGRYLRYTGLMVYKRPQAPLLVIGSVIMLFGLTWHYYHRLRDRRRRDKGKASDV